MFARSDPFWAILAEDAKKGNRWNPEEFFATGRGEIAGVLAYAGDLGLTIRRGRALDFGCGVGRLTQALADHFDNATGVDIAPTMLDQARSFNRHGTRVEYILNRRPDLSVFADGSFDFVYSNIVLQHMPARYARRYIREFLRVLAPGGIALFQVPSEAMAASVSGWARWKFRVQSQLLGRYFHLLFRRGTPIQEMRGVPIQQVIDAVMHSGGRLCDVRLDHHAGPEWIGFRYCVLLPPEAAVGTR